MEILICTYGRPDRQTTYQSLPEVIRKEAWLVVQRREYHKYQNYPNVITLPDDIRDIGKTRQWILDNVESDKIVMLDDDLVFATRRTDDPTKFHPSTDDDIVRMFNEIICMLDRYAHVGIAAREGANRDVSIYKQNTRIMRLHGIHAPTLRAYRVRYDRIQLMEDFDMSLQLLEAGRANIILNNYCHNQGGSNTAGGCSEYRTPEKQEEAAERLAALHPDVVTVVEKSTKTSWGGQTRKDVRIQWKKAFQNSHRVNNGSYIGLKKGNE